MSKGKIKPFLVILVALFVVGCAIRFFFLPYWITNHINSQLDSIPGYRVSYDDYSISLIAASVTLKDVTVIKSKSTVPLPFFEALRLRGGVDWNALANGYWVARVFVDQPILNFINSHEAESGQTYFPDNWTDIVNKLTVIPVNEITVRNGEIKYHDFDTAPMVTLHMTEISLRARNLQNASGDEKILSGVAEGSARVKNAVINIDVHLNAFYNEPMFQLNAGLTELNLVDVRDFLRAYGQFDVQQGLFSLYTKAGTRNNKVIGYVRPLIQDVTIASLQKEGERRSQLIRPSLRTESSDVWLVTSLVNNVEEIQFEGSLEKDGANLWNAVGSTLHNAFVEALVAMLEKSARSNLPGSPLPSIKRKQPASKVSGETKKKGILRKIFRKKEGRKKQSIKD